MLFVRNISLFLLVFYISCACQLFAQTTGKSNQVKNRSEELVNNALKGTTQPPVTQQPTLKPTQQPILRPTLQPIKSMAPIQTPKLPSPPAPLAPDTPQPLAPVTVITPQPTASRAAVFWTREMYALHDYQSFEKLPMANQRIDFNKIDYPLLHAAIFYETNRQRVANHMDQFIHSPCLELAAKAHSDDMVKYNFFSHTSVVKGKQSLTQRLAQVGIVNATSGENIADTFGIEYASGASVYTPEQNGGYFSYKYKGDPIKNHTYLGYAQSVVDGWMHSPGHRANILEPKFKYLGTGAAYHEDKSFHNMPYFKATQNFSDIPGTCIEAVPNP